MQPTALVTSGPVQSNAVTGDEKPDQADIAQQLVRKRRWFNAFETNKRREMKEARESRQYYHDKQWTDDEVERLRKRGQQATVRNRIKRKIDFLVGVEQRLRRDPKGYARTPQHNEGADVATGALRYACDIARWEKVSSRCMSDGLISGIGVVYVGIEDGEPIVKNVPVDRFFYDPRSVEPDFSDARYMGLHLWMDVDEATQRWPQFRQRLEGMVDANNVQMTGFISEQDHAQQWGDFENRRVRIVEFWEMAPLPTGGFGWKYCFFTGELYLEGGWSTYKGEKGEPDNQYLAWSPYVDERGDRYGLIRTMKSIQDEINYASSKFLHRLASDRMFYDVGTIEDPDELARQMARPDGKIQLLGGEWGKNVGIIDSTVKVEGEVERFNMAASEIENYGPNPGLVGKGEGVDGASGRALLAQRDSGMTELSPVFEQHRDWKLRVYRKLWCRLRQAWTGEKFIRVTCVPRSPEHIAINRYELQPDGSIQVSNKLDTIDVDIILNEGPDTITVNEELMQTLGNLGEAAMGPLGRVMIELSNAPNKERLLEMMDKATAPNPDVADMQRRMAQLEELMAAVNVDKARAEVENKRADTLTKIITAATPPQQQTDEFGNPMGPPPAAPDINGAMAAMQMFPLHYAAPTLEEQAEQMAAMSGMPQQQPQNGMMPPGMPQPGDVPPPMGPAVGPATQPMPEQMAPAGALPINPGA